jgi:uncharacterized membrane protein required for colicin V production
MNFLLDIFLSLLLLLIIIISTERGFVNSVWSTVTIIGAFVLAYLFSGLISDWICDNFVLKYVSEYAYGIVASLIQPKAEQYDISFLFEALPEEFVTLVENCGADMSALESRFSSSFTISEEELYSFAESVALPISSTISGAIAIVSVFLVSILILWLLGLIIKIIVKIPIIKTINSLLGFIFGVLKGFVVVWIVCVALNIFVERGFMNPSSSDVLNDLASGSYIFKFFCDFSPIKFINIG